MDFHNRTHELADYQSLMSTFSVLTLDASLCSCYTGMDSGWVTKWCILLVGLDNEDDDDDHHHHSIYICCFFFFKNYLLWRFYLHWNLYQEYLNLIFYFWNYFICPDWNYFLFRIHWIEYFIYIYIYIYIYTGTGNRSYWPPPEHLAFFFSFGLFFFFSPDNLFLFSPGNDSRYCYLWILAFYFHSFFCHRECW